MKYAVLIYSTTNVGDEFQSLAAMSLVTPDYFVLRDNYDVVYNVLGERVVLNEHVILIGNGWYMHPYKGISKFPIETEFIHPLMISFHAAGRGKYFDVSKYVPFWKKHEPLFCRDTYTAEALKDLGVEASFIGCLTLLINAEAVGIQLSPTKFNDDLLVDCKAEEAGVDLINPQKATQEDFSIKHDGIKKLDIAKRQLEFYSTFKRIFTNRLHVYTTCTALGMNVTLVGKICERKRDFVDLSKINKNELRSCFFRELERLESRLK